MKKRLFLVVLVYCCALPARTQRFFSWPGGKSAAVELTLPVLANELTYNKKNEAEKVRAIFDWVTQNISYGTAASHNISPARYDEGEDTGEMKSAEERLAQRVLRNRVGVCEGYAKLFKTLCDYAFIQSVVISGYARNTNARKFAPNHCWNGVRIDGKWYLLDATWASGSYSQSSLLMPGHPSRYFLMAPDEFIQTHYPDDIRWTLLAAPPLLQEFRRSPYFQKNFSKYGINSFFPKKGIISAYTGDTVRISIEIADIKRDKQIAPDLLTDTTGLSNEEAVILFPEENENGILSYLYVAGNAQVKLLYINYNNDLILRYHLELKDKLPELAKAK